MKKRVTLLLVIMIGVALVGCGALALSAAQAGVSIPAQMVRLMLPAVPMPAGDDPAALRALVAQNRERGPAFPSEAFRAKYEVQEGEVNGEVVWTVRLRGDTVSPLHLLYMHGSAYVNEALSLHWDIAEQLIDRTGATLVMPFYPLAPEHDWQPAYALMNTVLDQLVAEVGAGQVVIAGDSAGGGMALSLVQQRRDAEESLPAALVLFSPWLDVTLSDPAQPALDEGDPILSLESLRISGAWWAGNLAPTDPRISPLFGSLEGLPRMAVFTGTNDLLYPDATRLAERAEDAGVDLTLYEYPNMFHVWMGVMPQMMPEASRALDEAAAFIQSTKDA